MKDGPASKPCPFCAEQILVDARKCRHCQSMLIDGSGRHFVVGVAPQKDISGTHPAASESAPPAPPAPPAFWWLMVLTLLCPGYGTWRLGRRLRGFVIMAALLLAVLLWAQEAMPLIVKMLNHAMNSRATTIPPDFWDQFYDIIWYKATIAVFVYSFIDVILVQKGY